MHDPQNSAGRTGNQPHGDLGHKGQRALGTGDQLRGIGRGGVQQAVQVVAAGAPPVAWKVAADVVAPAVENAVQTRGNGRRARALRRGCRVEAVVEGRHAAVVQNRTHGQHVVGDHAVENRVSARAVVAHGAAHRGPAAAGRVRSQHQASRPRGRVEVIQHQARLAAYEAFLPVDLQHAVQVARGVQHHGVAHRLAGQAGAAAARQHRRAVAGADVDHGDNLGRVTRDDDADRARSGTGWRRCCRVRGWRHRSGHPGRRRGADRLPKHGRHQWRRCIVLWAWQGVRGCGWRVVARRTQGCARGRMPAAADRSTATSALQPRRRRPGCRAPALRSRTRSRRW